MKNKTERNTNKNKEIIRANVLEYPLGKFGSAYPLFLSKDIISRKKLK